MVRPYILLSQVLATLWLHSLYVPHEVRAEKPLNPKLQARLFQEIRAGNIKKVERALTDDRRLTVSLANEPEPVSQGLRPLKVAVDRNQKAIVELLVWHGADVNGKDPMGRTALVSAIRLPDSAMVELLLRLGADPNQGSLPALHAAVNEGHVRLIQLFLQRGASLVSVDEYGNTPLHRAVFNNEPEAARELLAAGAPLDVQDKHGETVLDEVYRSNSSQIQGLFVDALRSKAERVREALKNLISGISLAVRGSSEHRDLSPTLAHIDSSVRKSLARGGFQVSGESRGSSDLVIEFAYREPLDVVHGVYAEPDWIGLLTITVINEYYLGRTPKLTYEIRHPVLGLLGQGGLTGFPTVIEISPLNPPVVVYEDAYTRWQEQFDAMDWGDLIGRITREGSVPYVPGPRVPAARKLLEFLGCPSFVNVTSVEGNRRVKGFSCGDTHVITTIAADGTTVKAKGFSQSGALVEFPPIVDTYYYLANIGNALFGPSSSHPLDGPLRAMIDRDVVGIVPGSTPKVVAGSRHGRTFLLITDGALRLAGGSGEESLNRLRPLLNIMF